MVVQEGGSVSTDDAFTMLSSDDGAGGGISFNRRLVPGNASQHGGVSVRGNASRVTLVRPPVLKVVFRTNLRIEGPILYDDRTGAFGAK